MKLCGPDRDNKEQHDPPEDNLHSRERELARLPVGAKLPLQPNRPGHKANEPERKEDHEDNDIDGFVREAGEVAEVHKVADTGINNKEPQCTTGDD